MADKKKVINSFDQFVFRFIKSINVFYREMFLVSIARYIGSTYYSYTSSERAEWRLGKSSSPFSVTPCGSMTAIPPSGLVCLWDAMEPWTDGVAGRIVLVLATKSLSDVQTSSTYNKRAVRSLVQSCKKL